LIWAAELDHFELELFAPISRLGEARSDEGLEVFGRPESIHFEARRGRHAGRGHLLQGRDNSTMKNVDISGGD
jgi:hypothetical protein